MTEGPVVERLHRDVESILGRLVKRPEFADEIDRLRLEPFRLVLEVAQDRAVLARAKRAYRPVQDHHDEVREHATEKPAGWPEEWSPSDGQKQARCWFAGTLLCWLGPVIVFGWWLPGLARWFLTLVAFAILWALARYGLPPTVGHRIRWSIDHLRLLAGLPTRWWDQRQALRDVMSQDLTDRSVSGHRGQFLCGQRLVAY